MLSLRVLKLGKVKQFLPSYILSKNFYFNTIYRAEQRGLVTMYICYIYLCDQYTKRKQNIKERIDQSLNISVFKGTRFFVAFLFPALTVSGNESVWLGYLTILLDTKWDGPLQCVYIPCTACVKRSSFAMAGREI